MQKLLIWTIFNHFRTAQKIRQKRNIYIPHMQQNTITVKLGSYGEPVHNSQNSLNVSALLPGHIFFTVLNVYFKKNLEKNPKKNIFRKNFLKKML
jgi:hypothetical protein